jgi:hypothetical protein
MIDLGLVKPGLTIRFPWGSYAASTGASSAASNYADADILVFKDGTTRRGVSSGITATTSFDPGSPNAGIVGINLASIDLSDNTHAGFWAAGSEYLVIIGPVTVDSQTVYFPIARFSIGLPEATLNTTIATLSTQTSFTLTVGPAEDDALNGCVVYIHDVASAVQGGFAIVSDYTGSTKTVTLAAGTTFTAAATDNIMVMSKVNLPTAVPGAANGLLIAGSNAATTFATLTVSGLTSFSDGISIVAATTNRTGLAITGNGTGPGVSVAAGGGSPTQTAHGFRITGSGAGAGIYVESSGTAFELVAGGNGSGFKVSGAGSGSGVEINAGSTSGVGLQITSTNGAGLGITADGAGVEIEGDSGGVIITGGHSSGFAHGIQVFGGFNLGSALELVSYGQRAVYVEGPTAVEFASATGPGLAISSVNGVGLEISSTFSHGATISAGSSGSPTPNTDGLRITANGSGKAISLSHSAEGHAGVAQGVVKNVALANFTFRMLDTSGNPATGATVTATRRIDGGTFDACANSVSEVGNGFYTINLAAADLNGTVITLRFTATGCKDTAITIVTEP